MSTSAKEGVRREGGVRRKRENGIFYTGTVLVGSELRVAEER